MKTWNQLFVRHGWLLEEKKENVFNCEMETVENMQFLLDRLRKARVDFVFKKDFLTINSSVIFRDGRMIVKDYAYMDNVCYDRKTDKMTDDTKCEPYLETVRQELKMSDDIILGDLLQYLK